MNTLVTIVFKHLKLLTKVYFSFFYHASISPNFYVIMVYFGVTSYTATNWKHKNVCKKENLNNQSDLCPREVEVYTCALVLVWN